MSTLPPLPKPPSEMKTINPELVVPAETLDDLMQAAKASGQTGETAIVGCIHNWRYPTAQVATRRKKP